MYGFHKGQPVRLGSEYFQVLTTYQLATSSTMVHQSRRYGNSGTEKGHFVEVILRA